jgi:hypothetical protein
LVKDWLIWEALDQLVQSRVPYSHWLVLVHEDWQEYLDDLVRFTVHAMFHGQDGFCSQVNMEVRFSQDDLQLWQGHVQATVTDGFDDEGFVVHLICIFKFVEKFLNDLFLE